jgi:S-adenosylmethionine-diacylglycerol 3-amino-3-carboxypropyl transferase
MPARAGVARDIDDGTIAQGRHARLKQAVHRHRAASRQGLQERLFTLAFSGLVYPQIWEDPVVDMQALRLRDGERIAAIASGGCNVLSYLTAADVEIAAIDLNPAHVALNRLKLAAARHMPNYAAFYRFLGQADQRANVAAYYDDIRPHLDAATRHYWESRDGFGRRRIGYFRSGLYRQGLLGRFIGASHALARLHGRDPRRLLAARTLQEQRRIFEQELAPLFAKRHIRWLLERPASLFGLGIPPAQFEALKGSESHMANVVLARLERLACAFDIQDNYFAWQAFGRGYASGGAGPLPPYLRPENYAALRDGVHRVEVHNRSFIEHLAAEPPASVDGFVLLDAQDWMTDDQLTALWQHIARTARPGARVVFRTAGEPTILPGRVPDDILRHFSYDEDACRQLARRDRSCIYGGFHLYVFGGETTW